MLSIQIGRCGLSKSDGNKLLWVFGCWSVLTEWKLAGWRLPRGMMGVRLIICSSSGSFSFLKKWFQPWLLSLRYSEDPLSGSLWSNSPWGVSAKQPTCLSSSQCLTAGFSALVTWWDQSLCDLSDHTSSGKTVTPVWSELLVLYGCLEDFVIFKYWP